MIAKTEKAKELRRYFVKIEAVVHSVISKQVVAPLEITFTPEQINNSNRLINHYGPKKDIFYMFSFKYKEEMYAKFGIVGHAREFYKRVEEHQIEFGEICFHYTVKCKDVSLVESEFKNTSLYRMNKVKIPRRNSCGNHIEIIKLSEAITTDIVKEEMDKIADARILDPPPRYVESTSASLDIEKERTRQKQEETKQLQIQLEMKKLELGYYTPQSKLSSINIVSELQIRELIGENHDLYEELIEHFPKFIEKHLIKTKCEDDIVKTINFKISYKFHTVAISGIAYSEDIITKMVDLYLPQPELIGYKLVYYWEDYRALAKPGQKKLLVDLEIRRRRLQKLENEV